MARLRLALFIDVEHRLAHMCPPMAEQELLDPVVTLRNDRPSSELFGKDSGFLGFTSVLAKQRSKEESNV